MAAPVFEEFDPASDCDCPGCVQRRRTPAHSLPLRLGGHPAAHGARRALVLAAVAGAVLSGTQAVPAVATEHGPARPGLPADDGPENPQGSQGPLHGRPGGSPGNPADGVTVPTTTRTEIINRAKKWITAGVPYSMSKYWSDGYRQDCSGFVSMAWNLGTNEWTGSLGSFGVRIKKDELQPGDMLLFHNKSDPEKGSHVVLFGGWTDYTHTYYVAYEQTPPNARKKSTPYAYWTNSDHYLPYRYKGVATGKANDGATTTTATAFPGTKAFGPGADNKYVTQLGEMLIARGGARFYPSGAGPVWSEKDRAATEAFQKAQGWTGAAADGIPGATTWDYLVNHKGRDIPKAAASSAVVAAGKDVGRASVFPGKAYFRPGQSNAWIAELGKQLVKKGFGTYYTSGPGSRWTESDRRNLEAFQRAQGWRGAAADGYPGPETWRRLFS